MRRTTDWITSQNKSPIPVFLQALQIFLQGLHNLEPARTIALHNFLIPFLLSLCHFSHTLSYQTRTYKVTDMVTDVISSVTSVTHLSLHLSPNNFILISRLSIKGDRVIDNLTSKITCMNVYLFRKSTEQRLSIPLCDLPLCLSDIFPIRAKCHADSTSSVSKYYLHFQRSGKPNGAAPLR